MSSSTRASATDTDPRLLVACLCAEWCGSCRDYAATFAAVAASFAPSARFIGIDIEDEAALLDGIEVENFPTLLIARGDTVLFFGAITPHPQTLTRLVASALADELRSTGTDEAVAALPAKLSQRAD
jgi:thiol-disulfide isomerase/thioredoxin